MFWLITKAIIKCLQVIADGSIETPRPRLGPLRRRANKQVVIVQEETVQKSKTEQTS
jgi:hypothetical protein